MKSGSATAIWLAFLFFLIVSIVASAEESERAPLRHFVALKFKPDTTKQQVKSLEQDFQSLKAKIPQVSSIEWGKNISPENLNKGFDDAFLVTFQTAKDRDAYLVNPEHLKFKAKSLPLVDDVFILDFCDAR
jgi:hypothetical protein